MGHMPRLAFRGALPLVAPNSQGDRPTGFAIAICSHWQRLTARVWVGPCCDHRQREPELSSQPPCTRVKAPINPPDHWRMGQLGP